MRSLSGFSPAPVSLAFVGLMWTLPFLQPRHYFPLPIFVSEWLAFVAGLIALVRLAARGAWKDARLPAIALAPLGFAAFVLGLSGSRGAWLYLLGIFALALLLRLRRDHEQSRRLLSVPA